MRCIDVQEKSEITVTSLENASSVFSCIPWPRPHYNPPGGAGKSVCRKGISLACLLPENPSLLNG